MKREIKENIERLCLKEHKEGESTTHSGKMFHCDTVLGKKECKYESVRAKGWYNE